MLPMLVNRLNVLLKLDQRIGQGAGAGGFATQVLSPPAPRGAYSFDPETFTGSKV